MFAFQLCGQQIHEGHDARILYLYKASDNSLELREHDKNLEAPENHLTEKFPGWNPAIVRGISKVLEQFQPHVVQMNGSRTVKYGAFLRWFHSRSPWILIYRNIGDPRVWLRGFFRKWLYQRFLMPRVDGIVAISATTSAVLESIYRGPHQMAVIPRGVDSTLFVPIESRDATRKRLTTPARSPLLIFVGSLTPEKRIDRLLRVFQSARLRIPDLHLWLVGDGPLRKSLEGMSEDLKVSTHVRFLGPQRDVATLVNAADLFILTSDTEGIPGVVLEAGLLGVPCVASRVGGIEDCVVDGETSVLVNQENEQEFTDAVLKLIHDSELRLKMGNRAKELMNQKFTLTTVAASYLQFYEKVMQRRTG